MPLPNQILDNLRGPEICAELRTLRTHNIRAIKEVQSKDTDFQLTRLKFIGGPPRLQGILDLLKDGEVFYIKAIVTFV
jgi:hypothetical protein